MLNNASIKQTLVAFLLAASPALADPPGALQPPDRSFADWSLDCGTLPCVLRTTVRAADGSVLLEVEVLPDSLAFVTPLPLFLPDGLTLALGARPEREVPWRTCGTDGCEATLPMDPALLESLRRERAGTAGFTLLDGVAVRLPFSLMGFTAAQQARDEAGP